MAGQVPTAPAVWLSVLLFLLYTGVETAAGQWAYTLFVEGRGVATQAAGFAVSAYWAALARGPVAVLAAPLLYLPVGLLVRSQGQGAEAMAMIGVMLMTFFGEKRWRAETHPHESPSVMGWPMVLLVIAATFAIGAALAKSMTSARPSGQRKILAGQISP